MSTPVEIKVRVSPEIAAAYHQATETEQAQIQLKVSALLRSQLKGGRNESTAKLKSTMDRASQEAQARGLTPEILGSLLANE